MHQVRYRPALLISMDEGIEELAECVHPHPSITTVLLILVSEVLKSCGLSFLL